MKILLAEDDERLSSKLVRVLRQEAFAVDLADTGVDALHLGETGDYDCIVLDLGLPGIDGLAVLKAWRGQNRDVPVLILTARDGWVDKAASFSAGADDYLVKPFLAEELIARVRALARRARRQTVAPVTCGNLSYFPLTDSFEQDEKPLQLTAFETRILAKLIEFKELNVDREKLFQCVYEWESDVPNNSFEVLISRLRRKIGHHMIETARGYGYRLTAGAA